MGHKGLTHLQIQVPGSTRSSHKCSHPHNCWSRSVGRILVMGKLGRIQGTCRSAMLKIFRAEVWPNGGGGGSPHDPTLDHPRGSVQAGGFPRQIWRKTQLRFGSLSQNMCLSYPSLIRKNPAFLAKVLQCSKPRVKTCVPLTHRSWRCANCKNKEFPYRTVGRCTVTECLKSFVLLVL